MMVFDLTELVMPKHLIKIFQQAPPTLLSSWGATSQVDNLRTNHRGTFVLKDQSFRWLAKLSVDPVPPSNLPQNGGLSVHPAAGPIPCSHSTLFQNTNSRGHKDLRMW